MIKKLRQAQKIIKDSKPSEIQIKKLKQGLEDIDLLIEESLEEEDSILLNQRQDDK